MESIQRIVREGPVAAAMLLVALGLSVSPALSAEDGDGMAWLPAWLLQVENSVQPANGTEPIEHLAEPFELLGEQVEPGSFARLAWFDRQSFPGLEVPAPVLVAHGVRPGPVLCLTAAIHGDELNGIEIVRNLMFGLEPENLNGTVIGVPIVNLHGFRRSSRYLPDRRDLNRFFPGNPNGSSASRIAHSFFEAVVRRCDWLVDLHTGSLRRANLPQLRADLNDDGVNYLTRGFGATVVLHSGGGEGTLRRAATDAGIPAVTLEAGEPMRFQPDEVSHGVRALRSLLNHLGMDARAALWAEPQPVYYRSSWVRADDSGILTNRVELGQVVERGDLLGTITDPITNRRTEIRSPFSGRILGKALNQAMMPGFAAYHIGFEASPATRRGWNGGQLPEHMELGDDIVPEGQLPGERAPDHEYDPEHGGELESHPGVDGRHGYEPEGYDASDFDWDLDLLDWQHDGAGHGTEPVPEPGPEPEQEPGQEPEREPDGDPEDCPETDRLSCE